MACNIRKKVQVNSSVFEFETEMFHDAETVFHETCITKINNTQKI